MKKCTLLKYAIAGSIMLIAGSTTAQMTGGNIFLKGTHVEVGITNGGSYGAGPTPAGYHNSGSSELGFVADPAMDGWTVGTPPFFGDYFYPGTPYEGWSLDINGVKGDAYTSGGGATGTLTGSNVSYSAAGSLVTGIWQGSMDSVTIRQETILDTSALYFAIKVTLTNTASVAKNNIYYFRTLDPDNDVVQSGSFVTNNVITYQGHDTTVVTAAGNTYSAAYLALGAIDSNSEAVVYNCWPYYFCGATTLAQIYNHTSTGLTPVYTVGTHVINDIAIGLVFNIPHLASLDSAADSVHRTTSVGLHPANSASFTYFYAFSPAAVDSALSSYHVAAVTPLPTLVNNVNIAEEVKVYPNPSKNLIHVTGLRVNDALILYDMMGRPTELAQNGVGTYSISNLPTGNYLLQVKDAHGDVRARVRVQKQ